MSFTVSSLLKSFKVNWRCLETLRGVVKDIIYDKELLYVSQIENSISNVGDNIVLSMHEYFYLSNKDFTVKTKLTDMDQNTELLCRILKTCINKSKMDVLSLVGKNFTQEYENDPVKTWIKEIPLKYTVHIDEYNNKKMFELVCNVVYDDEKNALGNKKRNTLIKFDPCICPERFADKKEWLYMITINDRIVKLGGTRTGLAGRVGSYLCGHHIRERGKSGDCSKTNGYIYNTLEFYLRNGSKVCMYGYELPVTSFNIDILNKPVNIIAQTYHAYESTFMEDFKNTYGNYPVLCDNSDPEYKN